MNEMSFPSLAVVYGAWMSCMGYETSGDGCMGFDMTFSEGVGWEIRNY